MNLTWKKQTNFNTHHPHLPWSRRLHYPRISESGAYFDYTEQYKSNRITLCTLFPCFWASSRACCVANFWAGFIIFDVFDKSGFVCCRFICVKLWEQLRLFALCWIEELLKLFEFMEVLLLFEKSLAGSFWFDVLRKLFGWM